jgi:hypothetical protein
MTIPSTKTGIDILSKHNLKRKSHTQSFKQISGSDSAYRVLLPTMLPQLHDCINSTLMIGIILVLNTCSFSIHDFHWFLPRRLIPLGFPMAHTPQSTLGLAMYFLSIDRWKMSCVPTKFGVRQSCMPTSPLSE